MKIAFPVEENKGLDSIVHGHFGSAPFFVFVDLDADSDEVFENPDQDHQHGDCNPMSALGGRRVDGVVVAGIGGGALKKLNTDGITVYRAIEGTVRENARMIKAGNLPVFDPGKVCGHHHGVQIGGCAH
ncbi:NifB/NifX family molybdenum-iron cluster-binding protein [uncultured Desulfosarcina sp.]|uniref:NifB/NifX family molybdenum-iron cluster-binding protein n=1 Tax=uncultured Desulfosarcina sp. TaxID=218289 RepID=UPI0029C67904|nr:NifB/NifX family molybdenum-iron cluster-binding protein [uncultured Desulfosarcina sp.]